MKCSQKSTRNFCTGKKNREKRIKKNICIFFCSMRRFGYHTADRLERRRQDLAAQVAALNDNMVLSSVLYNL